MASYSLMSTPLDDYTDQITLVIPFSAEARRFYQTVVP
jgi:hypothetical protein